MRKRKDSNKLKAAGGRLHEALLAVNLKQLTAPIGFDFDLTTIPGVQAFNKQLIIHALDRKLDGRTMGAINMAVATSVRAIIGPTQVNVTQQVAVPENMLTLDQIMAVVKRLPLEMQDKFVEELRNARVTRPSGSKVESGEVHATPRIPKRQTPQSSV